MTTRVNYDQLPQNRINAINIYNETQQYARSYGFEVPNNLIITQLFVDEINQNGFVHSDLQVNTRVQSCNSFREEVHKRENYKDFLYEKFEQIRIDMILATKRDNLPNEFKQLLRSPYSNYFFSRLNETYLIYIDPFYEYATGMAISEAKKFIRKVNIENKGMGVLYEKILDYLIRNSQDYDLPEFYDRKYLPLEELFINSEDWKEELAMDSLPPIFKKLIKISNEELGPRLQYWEKVLRFRDDLRQTISNEDCVLGTSYPIRRYGENIPSENTPEYDNEIANAENGRLRRPTRVDYQDAKLNAEIFEGTIVVRTGMEEDDEMEEGGGLAQQIPVEYEEVVQDDEANHYPYDYQRSVQIQGHGYIISRNEISNTIKDIINLNRYSPLNGTTSLSNESYLAICSNYYVFPSPCSFIDFFNHTFKASFLRLWYIAICYYVSNKRKLKLNIPGIHRFTGLESDTFYFYNNDIYALTLQKKQEEYMNLPTTTPTEIMYRQVYPTEFKIFKNMRYLLNCRYKTFIYPKYYCATNDTEFNVLYKTILSRDRIKWAIEHLPHNNENANSNNRINRNEIIWESFTMEEKINILVPDESNVLRFAKTRGVFPTVEELNYLQRRINNIQRNDPTQTLLLHSLKEQLYEKKILRKMMTNELSVYLLQNPYFMRRFKQEILIRQDQRLLDYDDEENGQQTEVPNGYYPGYVALCKMFCLNDERNKHLDDMLSYDQVTPLHTDGRQEVEPQFANVDNANYNPDPRDPDANIDAQTIGEECETFKPFNLSVAFERFANEDVMYVWRERFEKVTTVGDGDHISIQFTGERPTFDINRNIVYYHYTPTTTIQSQTLYDYANDPSHVIQNFDLIMTFTDDAITKVKEDILEKNIEIQRNLDPRKIYPTRANYKKFNQNENIGFWFVEIKYLKASSNIENDEEIVTFGFDGEQHIKKRSLVFTLERFLNNTTYDLMKEDNEDFWMQYKSREHEIIPPAKLITDIVLYNKCDGLKRLKIGFFFPYVLKQQYAKYQALFNVYQCYVEQQIKTIKDTDDCFLYALLQHEAPNTLTEDEINYIKSKTTASGITFAGIKEIVEYLKIEVNITTWKYSVDSCQPTENHIITHNFKSKDTPTRTFNIGHFTWKNCRIPHYFINIPFVYREQAIKNLNYLLEEFPNEDPMKLLCYKKYGNNWRFDSNIKPLSSFRFLSYCILHDIVKPMELEDELRLFERIRRKEYNYVIDMTIKANQRVFEKVEKDEKKYNTSEVYFADTETITTEKYHKAFCICYSNYDGTVSGSFYGTHCLEEFLQWIFRRPGNPIVYFHNLKYDGTLFMEFIYMYQLIKKGGKIYEMKMVQNQFDFYKAKSGTKERFKNVTFKDSLALISMPIKSFNRAFQLGIDEEKEIYPYCAIDYISLEWCTLENCWRREKPAWNEEKIRQFKENLTKMNLIENGKWNVKKYTEYYCMRDVKILRDGFKKFRSMTLELLNIDILSTLTASGLAQKYMARNVYSKINCYQINGLLADMCRKACYGGRCMTRKNEKWHTKGDMCDYDACSLYPSAMHRLKVPTGFAWPMQEKEVSYYLEYLMDEQQEKPGNGKIFSYFIAKIRITKVHEHLDFPLICIKRDGINEYVDYDPLSEDKDNFSCELWVDSIYLQDLIRYQGIEYESCKDEHGNTLGVFWVGTKSSLLSDTIEKIYNERVELKKQKNPAQEVLKLIMNSSYGKCIQKAIETTQTFFCTKRECNVHLCNYYTKLKSMEEINDHCFLVNEFYNDDSYTMPHFGAMILSMSKRIMNEVFYAGKCAGCRIYYQDTDSLHIPLADLEKLQTSFKELYGRELTGKEMGQFHVDFEPINGDDKVLSKETIVCGKKCYLDVLQNSRGETSYHSRMKGISENCVKGTASNYGGMIPLYQQLFDHPEDKIHFDLAQWSPQFKMFFSSITSLDEFPRELSFTGKKNELEFI